MLRWRDAALYAEMKEGPLKEGTEFGSKQLRDELKRACTNLVFHLYG